MTDRLKEIRERAEKATPGPWDSVASLVQCFIGSVCTTSQTYNIFAKQSYENAEFIAHAREDIPWLIAEVERLSDEREAVQKNYESLHHDYAELSKILIENARLRDALKFYADEDNHGQMIEALCEDKGDIARAALEGK